jgi:hypothetical protein
MRDRAIGLVGVVIRMGSLSRTEGCAGGKLALENLTTGNPVQSSAKISVTILCNASFSAWI